MKNVIKGCWQMSAGHGGYANRQLALDDLRAFVRAGITTFDCADIYYGTEDLIGALRKETRCRESGGRGTFSERDLRVHTKFVPDLDVLPVIDETYVVEIINRSRQRLGMNRLDLVQFHWWDYDIPGFYETALKLQHLQREGWIDKIGLTNTDTEHLRLLIDGGITVVSNQVQYSVLDRRPLHAMADVCAQHDIKLFCYGTVAGGLLSETYLGKERPQEPFEHRSLRKYLLIVDEFGGWEVFQAMLQALYGIARKHGVTIGDVASQYVLQQQAVGGVILGASARRLPQILKAESLVLDEEDLEAIAFVQAQGNDLPGDVFGLERIKGGKHATIMKYNLNAEQP